MFVTSKIDCNYINFNYIPDTPVFDRYLNDVSGGNIYIQRLIWEMTGYCITPDISAQCFFVLNGIGGSGKSVLGEFIRRLFNAEAVSAADINKIGQRFGAYSLVGKRINIGLDLPAGKISNKAASIIKGMTGNDLCRAEAKYKDSIFFKPMCKFIFSSNFPVVQETPDSGFERRMIIIPFMYQISPEKRDINIIEKLMNEKEAIVFKALWHYFRLKGNNYIFSYDSRYAVLERADNRIISIEDVLESFIDEFLEEDLNGKLPTKVLYEAFINYCGNIGISAPETQIKFTIMVKSIIEKKGLPFIVKKIKYNNTSVNGITGLKLKNND